MLKIIHSSNTLPLGVPVDPTAEFEAGMFAQYKLIGNDIVAGVSDGTAPFAIIDDVRTTSFTKPQVDEPVVLTLESNQITQNVDGRYVSLNEVSEVLDYPNVVRSSFSSTVDVELNEVNGVITVPAGTELNYDADGDGNLDGFMVITNYIYRIANKPGDDSTLGSGRITLWYQRAIYATDQFDPLQNYPLNATLYVGLDGKLTTAQATDNHPGIAMVTGPPSASNVTLEFMLL